MIAGPGGLLEQPGDVFLFYNNPFSSYTKHIQGTHVDVE